MRIAERKNMGKNAFLDKKNKMLIWKPIRTLEIQNKNSEIKYFLHGMLMDIWSG
jgi:hypothetical protein